MKQFNKSHGVQRPKQIYYVLKQPIQNTFYSVLQESATHDCRRAIVAFRTKEHAQQFKRTYVNFEFEKHTHKNVIAKNIQPKAIELEDLKGLCELAEMDCICFTSNLEQLFLTISHQNENRLRAHFEQKFMMKSYNKMA